VQLGDRGPQVPGGLGQRVPDAAERRRVAGLAGLIEVLPGGEHVLQRTVVQVLGESAALPPLDVAQLGQEVRAVLHERADGAHPRPLDPRQPDAAGTDARQQQRAQQQ
jgi:hypothetical protein